MDINEIPGTWCRMWNDDAGLAAQLVAREGRMWSGTSDRLDRPRGPQETREFVENYQRERRNRFTPRAVVADGNDRVAYVWDVAFPDGTVLTGADLNVVDDGLVTHNWTIVGERRDERPDDDGSTVASGDPLARNGLARLADGWSPMWNGEVELAHELVSDDFRIWFGALRSADDELVGPAALAAYVTRHREGRPSLTFSKHRDLVVDVSAQRIAFTWTASVETTDRSTRSVGGIDVFIVRGGRLARAWSLTGSRPFTF